MHSLTAFDIMNIHVDVTGEGGAALWIQIDQQEPVVLLIYGCDIANNLPLRMAGRIQLR
jgi:hypothetical protein